MNAKKRNHLELRLACPKCGGRFKCGPTPPGPANIYTNVRFLICVRKNLKLIVNSLNVGNTFTSPNVAKCFGPVLITNWLFLIVQSFDITALSILCLSEFWDFSKVIEELSISLCKNTLNLIESKPLKSSEVFQVIILWLWKGGGNRWSTATSDDSVQIQTSQREVQETVNSLSES